MTNLQIVFNEAEAIAEVSTWVEEIQEKMTSSFSREWLETTLRDYLQQGLIEILQVIEAADNGDEIADAALRRADAELRERNEERSATLKAYGIKAAMRGPVTRGRGHRWYDDWRRNIGVACLVYMAHRRFGLSPTRNRDQRRRQQASACSVVAAALGCHRVNVNERRVENIWGGRLQGHLAAFLLTAKI
jgi:hypothetical protein